MIQWYLSNQMFVTKPVPEASRSTLIMDSNTSFCEQGKYSVLSNLYFEE